MRNAGNGTGKSVFSVSVCGFAICNGINLVYNFKLKMIVSALFYDSFERTGSAGCSEKRRP